jgi:hypothetical protein
LKIAFVVNPWSQRFARLHVDPVAVTLFRQPVDQGPGELRVPEKGSPLGKSQVGSDQGRLAFVPFLHQGEKQRDVRGFDFHITDFVDQETVVGSVPPEELSLRTVGQRGEEFAE